MSFFEQYNACIEEIKKKKQEQQDNIEIFQNKIKFGQCTDELNSFFQAGKRLPSEIKPKTYLQMIYSWFA